MSVDLESKKYTDNDRQLVKKAQEFADQAHRGQARKSGDPYITHPLAVAQTLVDFGLDSESIAAALLHDVVEDTGVPLEEIEREFGPKVAELVDGVTKMGEIDAPIDSDNPRQAVSSENIRKLLLAMAKDLRVILIKLADRKHNLETLKFMPPDKQKRIARESLEIYAPLADRLGMGRLKAEIEDLSFRYSQPEEYERTRQLVALQTKTANRYLAKLKRFINEELEASGVKPISIEARYKHLYSVYKKLVKADGDISKIYDLMAVRIIVNDVGDCYKTMGVLHQHFKPLIYRIKDYIAVPKPNGYRSLHTTVFALDGRICEFQIRTPRMHEEAERGLAAHFYYDAQKTGKGYRAGKSSYLPSKLAWVNSLADVHQTTNTGLEFVDALKVDLFNDRIFVFSPKGDLYDLPEGATPVDFAFAIHSDIGLRVSGTKVNGRLVPLDTRLDNRDVVDVLTRKQPSPNRDWLNFVKTSHAKNRIRAWFRQAGREQNITSGRQILESELKVWKHDKLDDLPKEAVAEAVNQLPFKDLDSVLAAVGDGTITVGQVMRKLFPPAKVKAEAPKARPAATGRVMVGKKNEKLIYHLAPCCQPAYPNVIVGYITRGSGVTVHRTDCRNLPDEPERLIDCHWEVKGSLAAVYHLHIEASNRVGLLRDITGLVSGMGFNIESITSGGIGDGSISYVDLKVQLEDPHHLPSLIKRLERLTGVVSVNREG